MKLPENSRANKFVLEGAKYVFAILMVALIGALIVISQGNDPIEALNAIISGAFGSKRAIGTTIRWATPTIITSVSALIAFRSGIWNVGIEGQMYFGAFMCAVVGYEISLPHGLHIIVCLLVAGLCGMLYALIPALLKVYLNVNELISTLMLNYVATYMTEFMTFKYMGFDTSELADAIATNEMHESARLNTLIPGTSATTGLLIGIAIALIVFLFYRHTVKGYEFKMVGQNLRFSRYGGVNSRRTFMVIFLVSGFIAGICGGTEMCGNFGKFRTAFATNLGWDGVMVASIARNSPIGAIFVSYIWGILKAGSLQLERITSNNRLVVNIVQALFVLMVSVDFRSLYKTFAGRRQYRMLRKQEGVDR